MRKLNNNNSIIFRKFSFRKIHLIPQVFSATKIPQNTPYKNSAFRIPQSTPSRRVANFYDSHTAAVWLSTAQK